MAEKRIDISVIVVFHNAASTISRTLESLAVQTPTCVEYIFVDDGSDDGSAEIVRQFFIAHPEFGTKSRLIINPECSGSANATAKGFSSACGEYVMRCDADDYLMADALQLMLDATDNGRCDVVIAPYIEVSPESERVVQYVTKPASLNDMYMDTLNFALWNKLLRRSLLVDNGIEPYEGLNCWEDLGVVSRVMALHPNVGFVGRPIYNYVRDPQRKTLTRSNRKRILHDHLAVCQRVEEWLKDRGQAEEFDEFLTHLKFCAKVKMLRGRGKDVARWKSTYPEVNNRIMRLRHVAIYWRLMFAAVAILPTKISQLLADSLDVFYISDN